MRYVLMFVLLGVSVNCARGPIKNSSQSLRSVSPPEVRDDLGWENLAKSLEKHINDFEKSSSKTLRFGPQKIAKEDYVKTLKAVLKKVEEAPGEFPKYLKKNFTFMEVYGGRDWGEVYVTSYFEPLISGRREPSGEYNYPLYKAPEDLVSIKFSEFAKQFPGWFPNGKKPKSMPSMIRGRLIKNSEGLDTIVPYYSRQDIDMEGPLNDNNLALVWVDPVDAFILQIQGSGSIELPDGQVLRLGYAGQNGHPYRAIGKFLVEEIPLEEMTLAKIEKHVRGLSKEKRLDLFFKNPSYVFFRKLEKEPITAMGARVIPGRTLATDTTYFPKGALTYFEFQKPKRAVETPDSKPRSDESSVQWEKVGRLTFDQDTGGAIRGPGRVDLFWGRGKEARKMAGMIKDWGRLYYLYPKKKFLKRVLGPNKKGRPNSLVENGRVEGATSTSDQGMNESP